jgi:hypothetical protein
MSNIEKALTYELKNDSGLKSLINERVYPLALPPSVSLPALTYQIVTQKVQQAHGESSFLPRPRVQFTAWGTTFEQVVNVGNALRACVDGFRGVWGTGTYLTEVESVLFADQRDFKDPETGLFYRQQDYHMMWKE